MAALRESPFTYSKKRDSFPNSREHSLEDRNAPDSSFKRYRRNHPDYEPIRRKKSSGFNRYSGVEGGPLDMRELDTFDNDEVYDISKTSIGTAPGGRKTSVERGRGGGGGADSHYAYRRDISVEKSCSFSPMEERAHGPAAGGGGEWYQREYSKINRKFFERKREKEANDDTFESFQRTFKLGENTKD